jgi:hypothetical protein
MHRVQKCITRGVHTLIIQTLSAEFIEKGKINYLDLIEYETGNQMFVLYALKVYIFIA